MVGGKNLLITSRLVQDFFHQPYASKVPYASPVFFSFHPTKLQQKGTGHHEHDAPAPAPFALAKVNEEHTTDVPGKNRGQLFLVGSCGELFKPESRIYTYRKNL